MTHTGMTRTTFALGASALAFAASLAVPAIVLAHPHPDASAEKRERIIILNRNDDVAKLGDKVRVFRMDRGDGMKCEGEKTEVDETTGEEGKQEKTKLFICHSAKLSSAERAKKLEEALERLRSEDHLSAEHKAKVVSSLEQAIAELRTGK